MAHGSGAGDLVRGELLKATDEPQAGDLLIAETDNFGGCVNVVRVLGIGSIHPEQGFYGIFVKPTDPSATRMASDQQFFVWWPPSNTDTDRYYRVESP